MKRAKKIASLMLALVMVLSLTVTAFAEGETSEAIPAKNGGTAIITAPSNSRTYEVYQIFAGDLSGTTLSNVKWGANAKGHAAGDPVDDTVLDALKNVNSVADSAKLDEIKKYVDLTTSPIGSVTNGNTLQVPTGYYLVKDNGPVGDGEAYSLYIVEVVGDTTITPKTSDTTSEKKVDDVNDSNNTEDETVWQDSADYDIGDDVPFQLKATITEKYDDYKTYKLTFHDKEDPGLAFNNDIVVTYKVKDGSREVTIDPTNYEVVYTNDVACQDGCTFEVKFSDLKSIAEIGAGTEIYVRYTSKLDTDAVIGSTGNKNTMHITYSNNPNDEQGGENGKTPDDTVIVFTFKTVVNKVEKNPEYVEDGDKPEFIPLKGAGFTLYKKNALGNYVAVGDEQKGDDMTEFTFSGLDAGDYKLVETTTPAGYNTAADIVFTITAEHTVTSDSPVLETLSGGNKFTGDVSVGELKTDVENNKGSILPSTGGIGTTIFYVVGSILLIGAAVMLIARRRMNTEK